MAAGPGHPPARRGIPAPRKDAPNRHRRRSNRLRRFAPRLRPRVATAARLLLLGRALGHRSPPSATPLRRPPWPSAITSRASTPIRRKNMARPSRGSPDRHDLQYNEGDAAYRAGEYDEAEEAFHKALQTPNPQSPGKFLLQPRQYPFGAKYHGEAHGKSRPAADPETLGERAPFLRIGSQAERRCRHAPQLRVS